MASQEIFAMQQLYASCTRAIGTKNPCQKSGKDFPYG